MKKYTLFCLLMTNAGMLFSQNCVVNIDSLKGTYAGDCKNGIANGTGVATGADTYSGVFKNGYPDGTGKYTWRNGDWYEGDWKNGLFEGLGTLHRAGKLATDNTFVMTGFWSKGKYIAKYAKPFKFTVLSNAISDFQIRKLNSTGRDIFITVKNITAGAADQTSNSMPKSTLVNLQVIEGRYDQQVSDNNSNIANRYILRKVTFPFVAILSFQTEGKFQTEQVQIELFEDYNWDIKVNVDI